MRFVGRHLALFVYVGCWSVVITASAVRWGF